MIGTFARCLAAMLLSAALCGAAAAQDKLRLVMVTHGAASNPFWAKVKAGADRAADEAGVEFVYRAPESFDVAEMAQLVTDAVAEKPDGLIVSIPDAETLTAPVRAALDAGIPVISINSGFDASASLGALLHVGQSEYQAGRVAGERMQSLGGVKALCLNHEPGNAALDLRCKGFVDGFGGSVEVMPVSTDPQTVAGEITARLASDADVDAILALNATIAGETAVGAVRALPQGRVVRVGSFDITDPLLAAVAEGAAAFAIDQQPFLQGYLPVQYLALRHRHGVVPVSNVSTGPMLVTAEEAARRLAGADADGGGAQGEEGVEPEGG